jgi:hypothetical protein
MESNADKHGMNSAAKREPHEHQDHHAHMAADFRKRLWISLVLTLPILVLSPLLQCIDHCRQKLLSTPAGAKPADKSEGCCG